MINAFHFVTYLIDLNIPNTRKGGDDDDDGDKDDDNL
jgi:hypothetical protein